MDNMRINDYIAEIDKIRRTGGATEHSYRRALQRLLADLMPKLSVINEPRSIALPTEKYADLVGALSHAEADELRKTVEAQHVIDEELWT